MENKERALREELCKKLERMDKSLTKAIKAKRDEIKVYDKMIDILDRMSGGKD